MRCKSQEIRQKPYQKENQSDDGIHSAFCNHHKKCRFEPLSTIRLLKEVLLEQREIAEREENAAHGHHELQRPRNLKGHAIYSKFRWRRITTQSAKLVSQASNKGCDSEIIFRHVAKVPFNNVRTQCRQSGGRADFHDSFGASLKIDFLKKKTREWILRLFSCDFVLASNPRFAPQLSQRE